MVYYRSSTKTKYHLIPSDFGVLPNYLPCAIMPHFHTWQQSKTCTPEIALIDKTKKLLLYAEYYVAICFSSWTPDYYCWKYVHKVLVNRLGGLSLTRKSVVRLTDRPDMASDVCRGRKTTKQQQQKKKKTRIIWGGCGGRGSVCVCGVVERGYRYIRKFYTV